MVVNCALQCFLVRILDCGLLFMWIAALIYLSLWTFFPFLSFSVSFSHYQSVSVWELSVLWGAAVSSRLHFTHTKVAVCCCTRSRWLALFCLARLDSLVPESVSPDQMGSVINRFLLNQELREILVLAVTGPCMVSFMCYQTCFYQD